MIFAVMIFVLICLWILLGAIGVIFMWRLDGGSYDIHVDEFLKLSLIGPVLILFCLVYALYLAYKKHHILDAVILRKREEEKKEPIDITAR